MATTIAFSSVATLGASAIATLVLDETTVVNEIDGTGSSDPAPAINGTHGLVGVRVAADAEVELSWTNGDGPILIPADKPEMFLVKPGTVLTVTPTA